ncbi:MAG: lipopolysaccharide heptosyltransferase family protein [Fusobacteria bacterium]|nr:lipopolysaccharide heptosyltransferase family protein [Fusobacteriota bacterium]
MRKVKWIFKRIMFSVINYIFALVLKNDKVENGILIIRLDAIGDYILFRNFIEVLKKDDKYKDKKITLIGNSAWKSIAEEFDSDYVDEFIWIERKRFLRDFKYIFTILRQIRSKKYSTVINPMFSREFPLSESIVKMLQADEKIGSQGDFSNIRNYEKKIADRYYSKLLPGSEQVLFEFERNREFFQRLLDKKIEIVKPKIELKEEIIELDLPKKYAIIFIGASMAYRKWSVVNYAQVGLELQKRYGLDIVLCGGKEDVEEVEKFTHLFGNNFIDLVGKTTLVELLYVLKGCTVLISNETSIPHFAVAIDVKNIFVISNGNHYVRFSPYPKEYEVNYNVIYHPKISLILASKEADILFGKVSRLNIDEITTNTVLENIRKNYRGEL